MGGKIDGYLDCTSPYSYFAITYLRKQRPLLAQYGVEVEFHPVFLGGLNVGSGNKPPWTLPAKARYSPYDLRRAPKHFDTPVLRSPPFFPILSVFPQRAMLVVKSRVDNETFERVWLSTWDYSWIRQPQLDISKPENLRALLREHFVDAEADEIIRLAGTREFKEKLTANTEEALKQGAFGAPWFWITKEEGEGEPVFGSDRWHYMWMVLGVPYRDVEIVPKGRERGAKL